MSCCWNIKRNEGKCIFLLLKQILAPSSCKFCWPAPNKVSWRGTDGGNDGGSGRSPPPVLLLQRSLSFAGKALEQYFSCQEIIFLTFRAQYFCTDPSLICSALAVLNCRFWNIFDRGWIAGKREFSTWFANFPPWIIFPHRGHWTLLGLLLVANNFLLYPPFLVLLFAYFDIKCLTKCFFEKSNGWNRWF